MLRKTLTILSLITTSGIAVYVTLGLLVGLVSGWAFSRLHKRKNKRDEIRKAQKNGMICAGCGYNMEGQTIPRCPECGVVHGTSISLDELGLTDEEFRRGFQRKRAARNLGNRQK